MRALAAGGIVERRATGRGAVDRRALHRADLGPHRTRVPKKHRLAFAAPGSVGVGQKRNDRALRKSVTPEPLISSFPRKRESSVFRRTPLGPRFRGDDARFMSVTR